MCYDQLKNLQLHLWKSLASGPLSKQDEPVFSSLTGLSKYVIADGSARRAIAFVCNS